MKPDYICTYNGVKYTRKQMDKFLKKMKLDATSHPGSTFTNHDEVILTRSYEHKSERKEYGFFQKVVRFITNKSKKEMEMMKAITKYEVDLKNELHKKMLYEKLERERKR